MFGILNEEIDGKMTVTGRIGVVRKNNVLVSGSAILILSMTISFMLAAAVPPTTEGLTAQEVNLLVLGYEEQVNLLKWVGGIMVGSLASAVVFLVRELFRAYRVLVNEVKVGSAEREKLSGILRNIAELLHDKPCLHETYLHGLAKQSSIKEQI